MSRRSRVALAPVYGGLPVRLYSHLATAVHQVAGDPGMVHHLVHTSIRSYNTLLWLANAMKILCSDWLTAPAPGCPRATPAWRWPSPSGSRRRRTPSRSGGGQSWTGGTFRLPFAICRSFFRSFPMVLLFLFILSANILLCRLTKFTLQYGSTGIPSKM